MERVGKRRRREGRSERKRKLPSSASSALPVAPAEMARRITSGRLTHQEVTVRHPHRVHSAKKSKIYISEK